MGYWLGITFSCLDVLCVAVFCDAFLERKTRGLRFVVGALLCGVLSYIATIFVSHISEESPITLLKFAALITVYFFFASLLYTGKFWLRLLVVVLAYAISTLLEFCVLYSLLALLHIRYDEYVANMKLYLASAAITYSLKFLLSSGIKKIHKPMVARSASIKWAPLTIGFPLISLVGISICYYLSMNGKIAAAFVLFSSGILLATNAVILILIDLTEKNNLAQEQQKTLNEQLRSQRANIDALSSAYATQRKMTHDFRHHIAALSGMLQGGETQQAQDYLAALQEQQTERALMVNTHNSAIDAVLNQKGYAAQKQHIDIQFEVNDLSPLQIELIDCTVVLGNLLDNAIKFTPAGGTIRFSVEKLGPETEIAVWNSGQGISPEALPYVFERFYKEDRSRGLHARGSGLGLNICKVLVNLAGGQIRVESQQGEWCRFVFTLPTCSPNPGGMKRLPDAAGQPGAVEDPASMKPVE